MHNGCEAGGTQISLFPFEEIKGGESANAVIGGSRRWSQNIPSLSEAEVAERQREPLTILMTCRPSRDSVERGGDG